MGERTTAFQAALEIDIGLPVEACCEMSPEDYRELIEEKHGSPMEVSGRTPATPGAEPYVLTRQKIEEMLDEVIGRR